MDGCIFYRVSWQLLAHNFEIENQSSALKDVYPYINVLVYDNISSSNLVAKYNILIHDGQY